MKSISRNRIQSTNSLPVAIAQWFCLRNRVSLCRDLRCAGEMSWHKYVKKMPSRDHLITIKCVLLLAIVCVKVSHHVMTREIALAVMTY